MCNAGAIVLCKGRTLKGYFSHLSSSRYLYSSRSQESRSGSSSPIPTDCLGLTHWRTRSRRRQRCTRLGQRLAGASKAEVAGPIISHDPPLAICLPAKKDEILAPLLATFAHGDRDQRLAAPSFVTKVAEQFSPQWL